MSAEGFGAMAAFTGNLLGSMAARDAVRETNQTNKGLAMWDAMFQRQMIQEQNEYNSPVNQMARYKEAGLNPNLMFGSIGPGQQSEIAKYQMPQIHTPDMSGIAPIGEAIQLFLNEKKTGAEIGAIEAQTERYREETRSLMLRNSWESFLSGVPTDNTFAGSRRLKDFDLKLQSQDIMNRHEQARVKFQQLSNTEKAFFNKNILPLKLKEEQLKIQGMRYENIKQSIDADLWRNIRNSEINSNPYRLFSNIISDIGTSGSSPLKDSLLNLADPRKGYLGGLWNKGKTLWQKYTKNKK